MKSDTGANAESIFEGKRKFHKAMAGLPIGEKIKIVAALQRIDHSIKPAAWKKRMMWPSAAGKGSGERTGETGSRKRGGSGLDF